MLAASAQTPPDTTGQPPQSPPAAATLSVVPPPDASTPPSLFAPPSGAPGAPPSMPAPAVQRPAFVVAEPTSGLPPGRLIPLPVMSPSQVRELVGDLATHIEVTGGYRRLSSAESAQLPPAPAAVTPGPVIA